MAIMKRKRCVGCRMVLIEYVDIKRGKCGACWIKAYQHPWKKDR